jgi:hypothetical protein
MIAVASLRLAGLTGFGGTLPALFAAPARFALSNAPDAVAMNSLRFIGSCPSHPIWVTDYEVIEFPLTLINSCTGQSP